MKRLFGTVAVFCTVAAPSVAATRLECAAPMDHQAMGSNPMSHGRSGKTVRLYFSEEPTPRLVGFEEIDGALDAPTAPVKRFGAMASSPGRTWPEGTYLGTSVVVPTSLLSQAQFTDVGVLTVQQASVHGGVHGEAQPTAPTFSATYASFSGERISLVKFDCKVVR